MNRSSSRYPPKTVTSKSDAWRIMSKNISGAGRAARGSRNVFGSRSCLLRSRHQAWATPLLTTIIFSGPDLNSINSTDTTSLRIRATPSKFCRA